MPLDIHQISAEPLSEGDIERLLDDTVAGQGLGSDDEDEGLRISLAGAQEKTALLLHEGKWCRPRGTTPTTHILKLPLGQVGRSRADFSTSVVGTDFEATIERFIALAPKAIAQVQAQLPKDFPAQVSDTIFDGVLKQADALRRQG